MENNFSFEQSFEVIKETINQTRMRFERNGLLLIFWGLVIASVSFGYYFLLRAQVPKAYLINLVYLIAAILTFVYYFVKAKKNIKGRNFLARLMGWIWLMLNVNIFLVAYGAIKLGLLSTFIILLLIAIGYFVTGIIMRSVVIIVAAVLVNIGAYYSLYLENVEQLLIFMGTLAVVSILIPGIILELKSKRYEIQ